MRLPALPDSKLPDVGTTIFTVMSALAQEHDAINLSQGYPDFDPPQPLLDAVTRHLQAGHNQYAPMAGLPELRTQIAANITDWYARDLDPETEVTVTSGATSALFSAIEAFVQPGDEVILFDPAYDSYDPAVRLAGGQAVHLPLLPPHFGVDWDRVRDAINPATRMIVLNSPHNPTGAVLSAADIATLKELVRDTHILLLSDEVYEHMVFDDQRHQSLLRDTELAARSLVVASFGKNFHATGWKIGYCAAPAALMNEFRRVHQFVQFCVATPLQHALADFLAHHPEHSRELAGFYQAKRDHFLGRLAESRFASTPSAGTYFQVADYGAISTEADTDFTRRMTLEKGVAAIPISVFYADQALARQQTLIRFCFAKSPQTIDKAMDILCAI